MSEFPGGHRFAFSILDDTDDSTLENARPVYDCLRRLGFRTTKTVWTRDCPRGSRLFYAADTLERPEYLAWVHELVDAGFELASHGATMESSTRAETERAIAFLEAEFGQAPRLHANHGFNRENLYWGAKRFGTPLLRWTLQRMRGADAFQGDEQDSPYFWGDLCRDRIRYVRNFTFSGLDMTTANPQMPYRLDGTPWVDLWFSTTDAPDADVFVRRVTRASLERLEQQGGVCIVSTHLGKGYVRDGKVRPEVESVLSWLADRPGWFVPVSDILDHLVERGAGGRLGAGARMALEARYLADQLLCRLRLR